MQYQSILQKFPIVTDQITQHELGVLLRELEYVLAKNIAGDVVELGCYEGTSALFESRLLQLLAPQKNLWLYDSFEGLPPKTGPDQSAAGVQFKAGELKASKNRLLQNFKKANLPAPHIKKAWFSDLTPQDLPEQICFAFLDGDFYDSILTSLKLVWPKMVPGGAVIIDDYHNEALPGTAKAVQDFFTQNKPPLKLKNEHSLAILYL